MHPSVHAANMPDKPAFIMASTGQTVTYQDLEDRSNQGAQLFRSKGLKKGDAIAIFMENNDRYFEVCWAAQRSGLYFKTDRRRGRLHRGRLRCEAVCNLGPES